LLARIKGGDRGAIAGLKHLVNKERRRLAANFMREERVGEILEPTGLVPEACRRLMGQDRANWQNRAQFMAIAARAMRYTMLQNARRRIAEMCYLGGLSEETGLSAGGSV